MLATPNIDYNEGFDNQLVMAGMKLNKEYEIVAGTIINSYGDRCAILGIGKNWYNYNSKISVEGSYAYVGEFFLHQFNNCKDSGTYENFSNLTKIGFAPYIYHGIKYKFHPIASFEFGLIFPSVLVGTIRWEF